MSSIVRITMPGKDINSENIIEDFILREDKPTFHVKDRMTIELTTDPVTGIGNNELSPYFHGFGYRPQTIAFVTTRGGTQHPSTYINVPGTWSDNLLEDITISTETFDCEADEFNIYVSALAYENIPMFPPSPVEVTYTFDILIGMEEALIAPL